MSTQTANRPAGRPRKQPGAPTHRKVTEQIRYSDASNWYHAVQFAEGVLGQPLNLHVSIHWRFAPSNVPDADRVAHLINVMGGWLRRRTRRPPVWAYVRENGMAGSLDGLHLHLLVHVPGGRDGGVGKDILSAIRGWVASSATDYEDRAIKAVWVWDKGFVSYLLKEGCDRAHEAFGVLASHRLKRNGYPVPGKRIGVSHSINATARARHATPLNAPESDQERPQ